MRAQGGGARTGWSAREGFAAVSLPPRLDPVVKAERERQAPGRPAACGRRREPGRRGAEAPRGEAGEKGPEPRLDLPAFSFPVSPAARPQDTSTGSHSRTDEAEIQGPDGKPGAWWPICGGACLLGLHPATGKLEFQVLAWDCRGPGSQS